MPKKLVSIEDFRDQWLDDFFMYSAPHKKIPPDIHSALARKLDIINAAVSYKDLKSPPGNRYEELEGKLQKYSSIRVNKQYRLIFKWVNGKAQDLYLDPHEY
ncbi:TPA: type II toxin-antitoxin system RelE/ParE family toxin [Citrobacter koseri]